MFILIDNSLKNVADNFQSWEFFYPDYPEQFKKSQSPFFLSKSLIYAPQLIIDFINLPVNITSVHRPVINQLFHYYFMALDLTINSNKDMIFHSQVIDSLKLEPKSDLFINLRKAGINGFGFGSRHLHIDIRTGYFNEVDEFGPYCVFDEP